MQHRIDLKKLKIKLKAKILIDKKIELRISRYMLIINTFSIHVVCVRTTENGTKIQG